MQALDENDSVTLGDHRPEVALAGMPFALMVSSLGDQLDRFRTGYSPNDYLTPILSARALLMDRHAGDGETVSAISESFSTIVGSVARAVSLDWGADLGQLGLDPCSESYQRDVSELYAFFVTGRLRNARELLFGCVADDRRRLADTYRRTVEKRNQTTAEARRKFLNFDDVVVWSAVPQILASMRASADWSFPLAEVLERLDGPDPQDPDAGFLASAARYMDDDSFAAAYVAPALAEFGAMAATSLYIKDRWLRESPKKPTEA
jgi:hypothetical protein